MWVLFCLLDVYESGAGPVSRAQHQGRHLQPGFHHHPHADWQPSLGPEIPTNCIPLLPLHCNYFWLYSTKLRSLFWSCAQLIRLKVFQSGPNWQECLYYSQFQPSLVTFCCSCENSYLYGFSITELPCLVMVMNDLHGAQEQTLQRFVQDELNYFNLCF